MAFGVRAVLDSTHSSLAFDPIDAFFSVNADSNHLLNQRATHLVRISVENVVIIVNMGNSAPRCQWCGRPLTPSSSEHHVGRLK